MDDEAQEQATIRTYDSHAASWTGDYANRGELKSIVAKFKKLLPQGAVLEIGAGGGDDGALLAKAGYDYLGTDASAGMIQVAREAYPDLLFKQCDLYDLADLHRQFDGFWASAVLLHVPKRRIDEALQAISGVTKSGGVGYISLKDGDNEEFEERKKSGRQEIDCSAIGARMLLNKPGAKRLHGYRLRLRTYR